MAQARAEAERENRINPVRPPVMEPRSTDATGRRCR